MNTRNARGILLMVCAMAAFAAADTLIKLMAGRIAPAQIMLMLLIGGLVVFSSMAVLKGERLIDVRAFSPVLLVRYVAEVIGLVGMVSALAHVPISTIGAILQASPLVVVLGAVLLLGEKVSWRRWTAIIVGFLGVLLILQPGADGFDANVLWAVMSMLGMSLRDLTTRMTPPDMTSASMATFTMIASLPFAILWISMTGIALVPAGVNWVMAIAMIGLGSMGYLLLIASIRQADISVVSPFRYARLIFLLVLGILVFGERPDTWMLVGAALIVGSGLYTMWREHQSRHARRS